MHSTDESGASSVTPAESGHPVTNAFNTDAQDGMRPLALSQLREHVLVDLLFEEALQIPGTSLLCNPSVAQALESDPHFIPALSEGGLLQPLLPDDTPTFAALYEQLAGQSSRSLAFQPLDRTRHAASLLDAVTAGKAIVVPRNELDVAKYRVSLHTLGTLGCVEPAFRTFGPEIERLASNHYDHTGTIPGSFWANLPGRIPGLAPWEASLREIGSFVFDAAYRQVRNAPLTGHAYHLPLPTLGPLCAPSEQVGTFTIPDYTGVHDLPTSPWSQLRLLSAEAVLTLREATATTRRALQSASVAGGSEAQLKRLHRAFDQHLVALSETIRSLRKPVAAMRAQQQEVGRCRTMLVRCDVAGLVAAMVLVAFVSQYPSLWAGELAALVGFGAGVATTKRKQQVDEKLKPMERRLHELTPARFRAPAPSMSALGK